MRIIDAQIHEPGPSLDWSADATDVQRRMMAELTLGHLDSLGIDGVVLFPADEVWAAWASEKFPARLAYVPHITPDEPDIEGVVRAAKQRHAKGQLGLRAIIAWPEDGSEVRRLEAGVWDPVFAACEHHQVPVFLFITSWLDHAAKIAARYPRLALILDHIGLSQPPLSQRDDQFKALPQVLALAKFPNLHIKLCGLPSLSREPYPYSDVAPRLRAIVDAFGADRLMWASDTTRFSGRYGLARHEMPNTPGPYPGKHTYAEALHFVRDSGVLSTAEKEAILGGTAARVLGWPQ
jgi:predicted TIM-barrel fold metal-dependent hydrolase